MGLLYTSFCTFHTINLWYSVQCVLFYFRATAFSLLFYWICVGMNCWNKIHLFSNESSPEIFAHKIYLHSIQLQILAEVWVWWDHRVYGLAIATLLRTWAIAWTIRWILSSVNQKVYTTYNLQPYYIALLRMALSFYIQNAE